jgi:hypothetical protein
MVVRREVDPVQVDGQTGDKDREVKIDPGETGETECDAQEVESFHAEISNALRNCHLVLPERCLFVIVLVLLLVIEGEEDRARARA